MAAEDNAAIVRGWAQAAFNQHDLDAAAQFLAPDWVGLGEEHGVAGFKRLAGTYVRAFPDMQIRVEGALAEGDRVVRRLSWMGTHQGSFLGIAPTGRRVRGEGTVIVRIADDKIAEEWETSNLLGLLQQLGAVPTFSL
jgi:predicted ester cyclase